LTLPLITAWERATAIDRAELEAMVTHWQVGSLPRISELLTCYDTLQPSIEVIQRYLAEATVCLRTLPGSEGRNGLLGLTGFLKKQTAGLAR